MRTFQRMLLVSSALFAVGTLTILSDRVATAGKPAPPPPYVYTDLVGFTGGRFVQSDALGMSNPDADGIVSVAGSSHILPFGGAADEHPVLWEVTGSGAVLDLLDLGTIPGVTDAFAVDVNSAGLAVGSDDVFVGLGFVSIPGIGLKPLPALGGPTSSAYAINSSGDIVGEASLDGVPTMHGALWHVDAQGNVIGPLDLGDFYPQDINDWGIMAGWQGSQGNVLAYVDADGLHFMPLPMSGGWIKTINNLGDVAGVIGDRAFVCPIDGAVMLLPDFGAQVAGPKSEALDINDQRQIVGWCWKPAKGGSSATPVAVLWENGEIKDLNLLAGIPTSSQLIRAEGINSLGQIVGQVRINFKGTTEGHAFLLTKRP